jgi:serine protease Do
MYRIAVVCGLFTFLAAPLSAADKLSPEEQLASIEEAMTSLIKGASPSVPCILVSRSEAYKQFGALPVPDDPSGQLGDFDAARFRKEAQDHHDRTREALVNRLDLASPTNVPESFGSGIIIDEAGLVLTPYHVVREATKVYVRLPEGKGSYADIHAADPRSDLAVLRLLAPPKGLKALPLDRGGNVRPGQLVVALTNKFVAGFRDTGPSANMGIVSAVRTRQEPPRPEQDPERTKKLYHLNTLIETDAKLNSGCSGGALLNIKGELIGITSSLAATINSDAPGGFAVPTGGPMQRIIETLKEGKEVEYGFLGVRFPPEAPVEGVKIGSVTAGSPADQKRIPANCYIVKVDGVRIRNNDDLALAVGAALAGHTIKLDVAMTPGGPTREYTVLLAKYYVPDPFIASVRPPAVGGLRIDYASTIIRPNVPDSQAIPEGVAVREVLPGSPAAKSNVDWDRAVITRVNGRAVFTPAQYYDEVRKGSGPLELRIKTRNNSEETVKLERK